MDITLKRVSSVFKVILILLPYTIVVSSNLLPLRSETINSKLVEAASCNELVKLILRLPVGWGEVGGIGELLEQESKSKRADSPSQRLVFTRIEPANL